VGDWEAAVERYRRPLDTAKRHNYGNRRVVRDEEAYLQLSQLVLCMLFLLLLYGV
jgi:hypothetical protein